MPKDVIVDSEVEFRAADFEVTRIKNIHVERLPTHDQHPLPKVEFAISELCTRVEKQRVLYVFLNYLLLGFSLVRHDIRDLAWAVDPVTPRVVTRFDDPQVVMAINHGELRHCLSEAFVNSQELELLVGRKFKGQRKAILYQGLVVCVDMRAVVFYWFEFVCLALFGIILLQAVLLYKPLSVMIRVSQSFLRC